MAAFCGIFANMTKTRVTLDLDSEDDTRLQQLAERRGQEKSRVISDALALLDTQEEPDIEEDVRRLEAFDRDQLGVPLEEVKAWVRSWGTANELPPPVPRKV
jgi:predicted transcriptional regulator